MSESVMPPAPLHERWLPVVGYEGHYEVSDLGRVRGLHFRGRPRVKVLRPRAGTYLRVNLEKDHASETWPVHRLVGEAFLGPLPPGMLTRHGPGGPYDNRLVNLSYGSYAENADDALSGGAAVRRSAAPTPESADGAHICREGSTPLSVQIAAIIRAMIESGEIQPDRPVPSKRSLRETYGVAANTVDRAMDLLRKDGLLYTAKGKGLFVIWPPSSAD